MQHYGQIFQGIAHQFSMVVFEHRMIYGGVMVLVSPVANHQLCVASRTNHSYGKQPHVHTLCQTILNTDEYRYATVLQWKRTAAQIQIHKYKLHYTNTELEIQNHALRLTIFNTDEYCSATVLQ